MSRPRSVVASPGRDSTGGLVGRGARQCPANRLGRRSNGARPDDTPDDTPGPQDAHEQEVPVRELSDGEVHELARTQDDVAQRARRLVAGELTTSDLNGDDEHERVDRLLEQARASMLAELRNQEQERARRQLQEAADHGEDAVAGVVQSITTIVRGVVPVALVRPEDVIEATFALADQGLRVGRRLALTMSSSVRSLSTVA